MAVGESLLLKKSLDLIAKQVEPLLTQLTHRLGKEYALAKATSKEAFQRYYETTIRKYSVSKTLLYRTTPVNLYDFYVDLDLATPTGSVIATNTPDFLLQRRAVLIVGSAGSGKSTLLRHLFLATIEHSGSIPLFIELRRANQLPSTSLIDLLVLICHEHNLPLQADALRELLRTGRFTIFLDAFDELTRDRATSIALEINQFVEQHPDVRIVVTSRPNPNAFTGWSFFTELRVLPLTKQKCLELVTKLQYDRELKLAFTRAVEERLFTSHTSFLSNPLLATLMLMTFEQFGSIDEKMHIFYSQAFDTLYQKHDASKVGYRREMQSALPADEFRALASAFCIQTYVRSELTFTPDRARDIVAHAAEMTRLSKSLDTSAFLDDMVMSVCLLIQDGIEFTFTHRSLQEYFAASFLLGLPSPARKQLLDEIRLRLISDDVAGLLFDMDPFTFEGEFLLPSLEELRRRCGIKDDWKPIEAFRAMIRYSGGALSVSPSGWNVVRASYDSLFYFDLCVFIARKYRAEAKNVSARSLKDAILTSRRTRRGRTGAIPREELHDTIIASDEDLADGHVARLLEPSPLLRGLRLALALPVDIRRRHGDRQKAIATMVDVARRRF